jgi:hypothetical protein
MQQAGIQTSYLNQFPLFPSYSLPLIPYSFFLALSQVLCYSVPAT